LNSIRASSFITNFLFPTRKIILYSKTNSYESLPAATPSVLLHNLYKLNPNDFSLKPSQLKKDKESSKENVEKRLEYIREELGRTEKMCTDGEEKLDKLKDSLIKKQQEAQAKAAEAAAAAGGGQ
jgi:hypothetical protein